MQDLRSFLVRTAVDDAFRDLVLRDPNAAFEGYDLDEADKTVLRRPDEGWLALMGGLIRARAPQVHTAPEPSATPPPTPLAGVPALPEARVLLTFTPQSVPDGESTRLAWGVSLQAWPAETGPDAFGFLVRVMPRIQDPAEPERIAAAATIQPAPAAAVAEDPPPARPPVAIDSEGIQVAADAARNAPADLRYTRIRELLVALAGTP